MFCPNCGSPIDEEDVICPNCGNKTNESEESDKDILTACGQDGQLSGAESSGSHKQIILVVVCVAVAMAVTGLILWNMRHKGAESIENSTYSEELNKDGAGSDAVDTQYSDGGISKEKTDDAPVRTEEGIHRYSYVVKDCTWSQAFDECKAGGGYMVRINSDEELQYIINEISSRGYDKIEFYIGGRRDADGTQYYWADEENQLYGDALNSIGMWCSSMWMNGEPSFADKDNAEDCMGMFFYKVENRYVWNDVPNDIVSAVPEYSKKVGYICEFEN